MDFKSGQYSFKKDYGESKFIKDIVAMANTPRCCSAYINRGGSRRVWPGKDATGKADHPDVAEGRLQLSNKVVREVFAMAHRDREDTSNRASDKLTAVERETLTLFARGTSYNEIGEALGISTVKVRTPSTGYRTSWGSKRNRS